MEASPALRLSEVQATRTMVDRVEQRFDIKPKRPIGDTAYGIASMLGWIVEEKQIEPHVPVWDKSARKDGIFSRSDFIWHGEADEYRCPMDKPLRSSGKHTSADTMIYRASVYDCATCALKSRCCPNTPQRKIARQRHENSRDPARQLAMTPRYERSQLMMVIGLIASGKLDPELMKFMHLDDLRALIDQGPLPT